METSTTQDAQTITGQIVEMLVEGADAATIRGLDETQLEAIYGLGSLLYEQGKFEQAEQVFAWLCREKPVSARFLKALGAARQMMGRYQPAIDAYGLAAVLNLEDPAPSLHAAECLIHVDEIERARNALDAAEEQAQGKAQHAETIEKIATLREAIADNNKGTQS